MNDAEFNLENYSEHLNKFYSEKKRIFLGWQDGTEELSDEMIAIHRDDEYFYINSIHIDAENYEDYSCVSEIFLPINSPAIIAVCRELMNRGLNNENELTPEEEEELSILMLGSDSKEDYEKYKEIIIKRRNENEIQTILG